jgi:DNA polymerase III delta subunit
VTAALGYFWGDDGYGLEQAAVGLGKRVAAADGPDVRLERWRTSGALATPEAIFERIATATMFGGGTLAIVTDPFPMIRSKAGLDAVRSLLGSVAPGNALVFVDPMERGAKKALAGARKALKTAVQSAGGETRLLLAPDYSAMPHWIDDRARELGIRLGRGAAAELARRVGATTRGGDIDRRDQGHLVVAELDKLSLLHVDGSEITTEDVQALVLESDPSSTWEFLDAFGDRRIKPATEQFDRILQMTVEPVIIAQLYTRIRQLLELTDRRANGAGPAQLIATMRLASWQAEKLARMSVHWTVPELRRALEGLFALDVLVKGADGGTSTEEGRRLAFTLWLADTIRVG